MRITDEQKERANLVNLPQFLMENGFDLKKVGQEYVWKEHDSLHIKDNDPGERGAWFRFSEDKGGDNIGFLREYMGMSFVDAVEALTGDLPVRQAGHYDRTYTPTHTYYSKPVQQVAREISLAEADNTRRVFAYLCKTRGLDYDMVSALVRGGSISQEEKTGNVLFKYFDNAGKLIGAEKVGTSTEHKFKGIATGSASGHGFEVVRGNGDKLYFFESAIDMLSYLQMHENELQNCCLVSMMGVKPQTVIDTMNRHKISPENVFICSDNDTAGDEFANRLRAQYPEMKRIITPDIYKDWNDMLRGIPKTKNHDNEKKEVDNVADLITYGNRMWNDATDNRDKSLISMQLADFQRMQDTLEKSGINYYAYEMNGTVRMAVNDKDIDWMRKILGNVSITKSNRPYSPPEKNIFGTAEYRYIPQKEYLTADRDLVLKMAEIMAKRGLQFSGRIYPSGKGALTVSRPDLYTVRSIRNEVINMRKQFASPEKAQEIGNRDYRANRDTHYYMSKITPEQFTEIKPFLETSVSYHAVSRERKVMFALDKENAPAFHRALENAVRETNLLRKMADLGLSMEQNIALSPVIHRLAVEDMQIDLADFFDSRYDDAQFGEMLSLVNDYLAQPVAERFGEHSKLNEMLEAKSSFDRSIELSGFFSLHDFSDEQRAAITAMFVGDVTRGQIDSIDETFTAEDIQAYDEILHSALQESDVADFLTAHKQAVIERENSSRVPTEEVLFPQADIARFIAEHTMSSDDWEEMARPLFENGYLDNHKPNDKAAFGYHLSEPELYELAERFRYGDDIRREFALALLEGGNSADIEFVFEDGKISDRTFYYAENLRHNLHLEKTEKGYNCTFNGMEHIVSFEEIGQAFLDRIHEEFEDLMYLRVLDFIKNDIPNISDDTVKTLITAFDSATMHGWENGDNQPKINRIKKALYDILGDEEQTEKAFACIAKYKYNVEFNDTETRENIHFGLLGNGITAYDVSRTDKETNDYPTVAHISPEGIITLYDKSLSDRDMELIKEQAKSTREKFLSEWRKLSTIAQYQKLMDNADISTLFNINREKLSMEEKIEKYMPFVFFKEGERPEPEQPKSYRIYQLPDGEKYHGIRFEGKEQLKKDGVQLNHEDYALVYEGEIPDFKGISTLENLYTEFNSNHPDDFTGHSLSVSDVVVISDNGTETAYFCDKAGFTEMPEFFREKEITREKTVLSVSDLEVGDVIFYEGKRREVEKISDHSISLKDLDAPDYGGILLDTSDVLAYNGWQQDMEEKGFEILSKAAKSDPVVDTPEQVFELNPPKDEPEKLQTLQQVVDKFFGTDCESAETEGGTWKLTIADGDKVGELFYGGEPVCGIYNRGEKMEIEPYCELTTFLELLRTAMLEHNPDKPVEIMEFQRTFETPLDKAKWLINEFSEREYEITEDFANMHNIGLAYTTLTDGELPVQVTADLVDFKITYEFDGEVFKTEQYESIEDMVENGLTGLDFSNLVSVPDEVVERHTKKEEQTVDLMSDAADVADNSSPAEDVPEITLKYKGDSESLDEIKDKALSLGATVIADNADGVISIDTYENHRAEIDGAAYELGLMAVDDAPVEEIADIDRPLFTDAAVIEEIQKNENADVPFWETPTIEGEQLTLFGDSEPIQQKKPEKPKSQFASGPVVDGVQVYEALAKEIDRGTGFVDGKLRVQDFFEKSNPTTQQLADFLKKEYGTGGHSGDGRISLVDYDSKGLTFSFKNGEKFRHSWYNVATMVKARLDMDTYLTAEEKAKRQALADEKGEDLPDRKNSVSIGDKFRNKLTGFVSEVVSLTGALPFYTEDCTVKRLSGAIEVTENIPYSELLNADRYEFIGKTEPEKEQQTAKVIPETESDVQKQKKFVPIYKGDWEIANNRKLYREIVDENRRFAEMAKKVIGNGLDPVDSVKALAEEFGFERTAWLTALNIAAHPLDGRFYPADKKWASDILSPFLEIKPDEMFANNTEKRNMFNRLIDGGMLHGIHNTHLAQFAETLIPEYAKYLEIMQEKPVISDEQEVSPLATKINDVSEEHENADKGTETEKPEIPTIKNLSQLKKAIKPGMMFEITDHLRPECIGERRIVTGVNTVDFTSRKLDENGEPTGKDLHMEFDRAKNWTFDGSELTSRLDNGDVLMSFHFIENLEYEQSVQSEKDSEIVPEIIAPELSVGNHLEYKGKEYKVESLDMGGFITLCDTALENAPRIFSRVTFLADEFLKSGDFKIIAPEKSENFTITDDALGEGGAKAKFRANVDAIKTLKNLEKKHRPATAEEKEILSRYVGWGALPLAFDKSADKWAAEYAELKELLTPQEYAQARSTVNDAFFTSPLIIDGIYEALENFGFEGGNVLEPSCGVGNFFGRMPEEIKSNSNLYGVEIDSISGRIAQMLYPDADIVIQGFEKNTFQNDCFDVAVGNVPFGELGFKDTVHGATKLHDYFFLETIDKLKNGGVMAFVTSAGTLDKRDESVRRMLADKADFIGAIRLPGGKNGAFKDNAGTQVTTDIIFLQKHEGKSVAEMSDIPDWVHIGKTADGLPINKYFEQHPDMVLGTVVEGNQLYGSGTMVVAEDGFDLKSALHEAVGKLSAEISHEKGRDVYAKTDDGVQVQIPSKLRNYSFFLSDDTVFFKKNNAACEFRFDKNNTQHKRFKAFIELRDLTRELIEAMELDKPDSVIKDLQTKLNTAYDDFYKKFGLIHSQTNKRYFAEDVSYNLVAGLEKSYDKTKLVEKSDIFSKRTIMPPKAVEHVDTSLEALTLSVAEKVRVDFEYMGKLTGMTEDELKHDLVGEIFKIPHTENTYQTASEYLSGDIRKKLREAEEIAEYDADFNINVSALKKAMPEPLKAGDIDVKIGATWIDPKYYEQFMYELLQTPAYQRSDSPSARWNKSAIVGVEYSEVANSYHVSNKSADRSVLATQKFGTHKMNAYDIFEHILNLQEPKVYKTIEVPDGLGDIKEKRVVDVDATRVVQRKADDIRKAFKYWIFKDPQRREAIVQRYNELFNSIRPREYDGSALTFPLMNSEIQLHEHQKNAIAHALFGGNTLFAHSVGAGKTFEMIATAMEAKRLGLCTKSLFAVPNHLTEQIGDDFQKLYPGANILVATKKDFQKANRQQLFAKIATGNYDAIIIGHSQLGKIPVSKERQVMTIQSQIDDILQGIEELKRQEGSKFQIKAMERTRKSLQKQLDKLEKAGQDDTLTFEQLGIDRLFVDEAHECMTRS